jgi:hypothetical protein
MIKEAKNDNPLTKEEQQAKKNQKLKDFYKNESNEDKEKRILKHKDGWTSISDEGKQRHSMLSSAAAKKYWNNLTPEEKEFHSIINREHMNEYWNNISKEEFYKWSYKQQCSQASLTEPNQLESYFLNELNILKMCQEITDYQFQYVNQTIHPDFEKLFPVNPIRDGRVSPYHKWDFCINVKNTKILVDIDGPIHDLSRVNAIINDWKYKSSSLSELLLFYNSLRPYQRDNLDAYTILAYDNKIDDNNQVLNIQTNKHITYLQWIPIITSMMKNFVVTRDMIST